MWRAADLERSVDCGDAIAEALQARALAGVHASDAVVADLDREIAVATFDRDPRAACLRVFRHVGERLAHGEVGRGFHRER
jgi:hypothetical protein